jgi:hypothetical protein
MGDDLGELVFGIYTIGLACLVTGITILPIYNSLLMMISNQGKA